MFRQGEYSAERGWIARGLIGGDSRRRHAICTKGLLKEGAGGCSVTPITEVHVDDLPVFINGSEYIPPASINLQVGLIHAPALTDGARWARAASMKRGVKV